VHWSESLVALVTLNCFMLAVVAELLPAVAVAEPFVPGAALAEAWSPGPVAVAVLAEFVPLVAEPSVPLT